jgi:hypothetical protein
VVSSVVVAGVVVVESEVDFEGRVGEGSSI